MENQENPTIETQPLMKSQLPNATAVLVMGIISIVCFCCLAAGILGITLGIIAVVLGHKAIQEYHSYPEKYTEGSYKNAKAGKVCGIIGLSLGGLWLIGILIYLSIVGWVIGAIFTALPWEVFSH
ncbi:MAG TPA: hypothetical protein DCQ26_19950 [Marinilabiliales bacterium]|jgi:hypothetical protein|nr:hypothetical protein [Marinilabiliales bacterium]HAZ04052.1 hypothetical protein [Marinilabiliales bacterium]HBO75668.1 hypothetical protein [Marinilabiliales bacterium]HBX84620.1 hypothetical protein [Marinilabiliales bacterium]HBY52436.1 hypothetical protein [Marinilabiliales bacterium]